jgi:hypothetical protein
VIGYLRHIPSLTKSGVHRTQASILV